MSLRSRILAILLATTLIPLLGIAGWACVHAFRWSGEAVQDRLAGAAERAGAEVTYRHALLADELQDLGAALLEESADVGAAGRLAALIEDLATGWDADGAFLDVRVLDANGETLQAWERQGGYDVPPGCFSGDGTVTVTAHVGRPDRRLTLAGRVPADRLLSAGLQNPGGASLTLVDRSAGALLADPVCALRGISPAALRRLPDEPRGAVQGGRDVLAWQVAAGEPGWAVLALPSPSWPAPFSEAAMNALLFALLLSLAAGGAFLILIRDLTRSVGVLTTAATRIGGGDFSPWLPPPGNDEVGRLALAIGAMAARLDQVMAQNARNRQMAAIGEMASHISHEIRNPLSSIRLNLQSIEREVRDGEPPADLHEVLTLCLREVNRLEGTVSGVLRLAGVVRPDLASVRLQDIVDEAADAARPLLGERDIRLRVLRPGHDIWVRADVAQMRGVFLNLFNNARDALADGGSIQVRTELVEEGGGRQLVRVHVTDDGEGVPPELRDRIFDPFFTTKPSGSGIGLPIAARTLEAHGGRLFLERRSELERGAHFVVELRTEPAPRGAARDMPHDSPSLSGVRALGTVHAAGWRRTSAATVEAEPQ